MPSHTVSVWNVYTRMKDYETEKKMHIYIQYERDKMAAASSSTQKSCGGRDLAL